MHPKYSSPSEDRIKRVTRALIEGSPENRVKNSQGEGKMEKRFSQRSPWEPEVSSLAKAVDGSKSRRKSVSDDCHDMLQQGIVQKARGRASIDLNAKYLQHQGKNNVRKSDEKSVPSRRAISIDGDSIKHFQTAHILRPQYLDITKLYEFGSVIGEGAFGVVRLCTNKLSGQSHACKTILKSNLKNKLDIDDLKSEVNTLQTMQSHPSVVRLSGVFEDSRSVHLVMEYCGGGDLYDRIKERKSLSERKVAIIINKLASVLATAHDIGIMHRDIKPENILLISKDSDTDIRLADFGSAAVFKPGQELNQLVGSPLYIAPSVQQHSYGTEADMWSLGVVMYVLLAGVPPFLGKNNVEIFRNIREAPLDLGRGRLSKVSPEAKKLLTALLNRNLDEAISADDVLEHPWIESYCSEGVSRTPTAPPTKPVLSYAEAKSMAMAAARMAEEASGGYSAGAESSSRSKFNRRRSMGMYEKNGNALVPIPATNDLENASDDEERPARPLRNILNRMPTPFRPSNSSETDADDDKSFNEDEENDDQFLEQESVYEAMAAQVITVESINASLKQSISNHGDLLRRLRSESSDDLSIPVAQAIDREMEISSLAQSVNPRGFFGGGKLRLKELFKRTLPKTDSDSKLI